VNALHESRNVLRLKYVSAKEHAGSSGSHDAAHYVEDLLIGSGAAATQHQDGYGAAIDDLVHTFRIAGVLRLDHVGAEFGRNPRVQQKPLRIPGILDSRPPRYRLHNQGKTELLTFPRGSSHTLDFVSVKIRIAAADDQKHNDGVRSVAKSFLGARYQTTAEGATGNLAGGAEGGRPVEPGNQAGQVFAGRSFGDMSHHAQVEEQSVSSAFDESGNLAARVYRSRDGPEHQGVIKCDDEAAAAWVQDAAEASRFTVLRHLSSSETIHYTKI
jgi:hypothetical protein